MNPILWYRSPVFVGLLVTGIAQLLEFVGAPELVADKESLKQNIEGFLEVAGLIAAGIALVLRKISKLQPVALTKAGEQRLAQKQAANDVQPPGGSSARMPAVTLLVLSVLGAQMAAVTLTACKTPPTAPIQEAQGIEAQVAAAYGEFVLGQRIALRIARDQSIPADVRRRVIDLEASAKPWADQLMSSLILYRIAKAQGTDTSSTESDLRTLIQSPPRAVGDFSEALSSGSRDLKPLGEELAPATDAKSVERPPQ